MTVKQVRFVKADSRNPVQDIAELAVFDASGEPLDPPTSGGGDVADSSVTTAKLANNAVTEPKIASNAVTTVKIADDAVTAAKIADGVIPVVPGKATTSADGLMSKEDKAKLDGVANNANNYTLPAATTGALGGVKKVAHVADPAGDTPTKTEYIALRDAMVNAGLMESA